VKILVLEQGVYGRRIADNIRRKAPSWEVSAWTVPAIAEPVVDDPDEYLPPSLPVVDLILHLGESPQAAQLLPAAVRMSRARAVIASIDSSAWIPLGLRNQLRRELEKQGVTVVFPEPLCSIDEQTVGFGESLQPYTSEVIREFSRHFGKPVLHVALDGQGKIAGADVLRGSPCGSTEYTVGRIKGMDASRAVPTAGLMCLHYPCLASMKFEQTDNGVDTIMHNSGRIFNEGLENALKKVTE
jgi:thymidylate synthase